MSTELQQRVRTVKTAKATTRFGDCVKTYGTEEHALRALDCMSQKEAIQMLALGQTVSIFKRDGRVVVE
jgi:hypothetical protein